MLKVSRLFQNIIAVLEAVLAAPASARAAAAPWPNIRVAGLGLFSAALLPHPSTWVSYLKASFLPFSCLLLVGILSGIIIVTVIEFGYSICIEFGKAASRVE